MSYFESAKALVSFYNKTFGKRYHYKEHTDSGVVYLAAKLEVTQLRVVVIGERLKQLKKSGHTSNSLEETFDLVFDTSTPTTAPAPAPATAPTVENAVGVIEKALAAYIADQYMPSIVDDVIQLVQKKIGPVERDITFSYQGKPVNVGLTHEQFETISILVQANEPVMLVGPAGTGKNHLVKQVADALEKDFYFTNSVTQEYKLTGFVDAGGTYRETEFYKAFTNGGVFMLDEVDASIPEALIILNAALANRYFPFPNGHKVAHPDFRVVAAGNTLGNGGDEVYIRNQLDGATLNRFAVVFIDYSPAIESGLTDDKELVDFIRAFRKACEKADLQRVVSYRDISRIEKLRHSTLSLKTVLQVSLLKGMNEDDLRSVKLNMSQMSQNKYYKNL